MENSAQIMKTRIFILCAGTDGTAGDTRKELLKILGEPIIDRTIRLFQTHAPGSEIFVVTQHKEIIDHLKGDKISFINPAQRQYPLETMMSTQKEWVDQNIILHGDVIFSTEAVKTIIETKQFCFFCRIEKGIYTGRTAHEVYGMQISLHRKESFKFDAIRAIELSHGIGKGRLKRLANYMTGTDINSSKMKSLFTVNINDATDDIDSMRRYRSYQRDILDQGLLK